MPRRHTPPTPTTCAHCGTNIRGRVRAVRRPGSTSESDWEQRGGRASLCIPCSTDATATCASCGGEFYPPTEMVRHRGRTYCYGCDPTPRCGQCGGQCVNGETVHFRNRSGVDFHFCSDSCAEEAGFVYDHDCERWNRDYENYSNDCNVRFVPWECTPRAYFRHNKGPRGHLTFGIEVEGKMEHAPEEWECVRDESMWYEGRDCWEIVSPVLQGPHGACAARGALRTWAYETYPRPSIAKNAGVHVHVGLGAWADREFVARLVDHWEFWGEDFFAGLVTGSRLTNQYCGSIKGQSQGHWVRSLNFEGPATAEANGGHFYSYNRRKSLNLASIAKHGTVEFRLFNASTDPRKIMGWTAASVNFVSLVARLPRGFTPRRVQNMCERHGVMRVGLRLLDAGSNFDEWVRERWSTLNENGRLSEAHMCHDNAKPWTGDKSVERRARAREDRIILTNGDFTEHTHTSGTGTIQGYSATRIIYDEVGDMPETEWVPCPACRGDGWTDSDLGTTVPCPACNGHGRMLRPMPTRPVGGNFWRVPEGEHTVRILPSEDGSG